MLRRLFRYNETYVFLLIVVLGVLINIANPAFFTFENVTGFLKSYSMLGVMAVGSLFVFIIGGPDISFTAVAQVVEYSVVVVTIALGGNILFALFLAAVMGLSMGLINGVLVHYFRVPVIIVTIATYNIFFGLLYVISKGKLINTIPQFYKDFGNVLLFPQQSVIGGTYGLSLMPIIWVACIFLGWFILKKTVLGRSIYAMGGNMTAAERIGFKLLWIRMFVFGFVGFLSGIAAIVHVCIVQSVVPNIIVGKELEVIAAVVIGGAGVFGGTGTVWGTFLGVLLFAIINNGLTLLNISSYWYDVTIGVIITVAVSVSALQTLYQRRNRVHVNIED